jgi:septum formation protein
MTNPFWLAPEPLLLASGSATRRALLESAQIPFDVEPARIDERQVEAPLREAGANAATVAESLALAKAEAVSRARPGTVVLGADQTLELDGRMFTKPESLAAARTQLEDLSGRTHSLFSAWALVRDGQAIATGRAEARLFVRVLSSAFLEAYLAREGDAILGSVGAYRVEGLGVQLFERVEGDHTTVLGLPLLSLLPALRRAGMLLG